MPAFRSMSWAALGLALASGIAGCASDAWLFATASLGGDTAGQRGNVQVVFINNTPYRATFTFGAYDNLDRNTAPALQQFSSETDTRTLEGDSETEPITVQCHRIFSIGGEGLIARVQENLAEDAFEEAALVPGVYFSSLAAGEEFADLPNEGVAAAHDAFIGADFDCGSLIVYRLEFSDAGEEEFEIQMSVIPSESTR